MNAARPIQAAAVRLVDVMFGLLAAVAVGSFDAPSCAADDAATAEFAQPDGPTVEAELLNTAADEEGFVSLFNGKDLSGWTMVPNGRWIVEDGVITLRRDWDGREHNYEYLWAKDTYADFILELEYKVPERANSGVFLRTSDKTDPVYTGIEVQVSNSYGKEQWGKGNCAGAIYDCLAPTKNTAKKPGEWNRVRITCRGANITVRLNGEQVIDMDLDRWTEPHKNPDGSPNKFPTALKDFARTGYIGLQDHGRPVWYRNIRVKRLED